MTDAKWFALMVCVCVICFFGFLSIQSISNSLNSIANKSTEWKEISININLAIEKVIELQRIQNENNFDENVMNQIASVDAV